MATRKDAILAGIIAVDNMIATAIQAELSELLPSYELAEEQAAGELRDAVSAMEEPRKVLAELRISLDDIVKTREYWQKHAVTGNYHDKTASRAMVRDYDETVLDLEYQIKQAEAALKVLADKRDAAQARLHDASEAHSDFKLNIRFPFVAYGQQTQAYRDFRLGSWSLQAEIIKADADNVYHPERDQFRTWQDELSQATNYSTADLEARMRQHAREEAARNLDAVLPERASAPSGQDLVNSHILSDNKDQRPFTPPRVADIPGVRRIPGR